MLVLVLVLRALLCCVLPCKRFLAALTLSARLALPAVAPTGCGTPRIFTSGWRSQPRPNAFVTCLGATHRAGQGPDIALFEFDKCAALEATWKQHGPVANADQTADRVTNRLKHAAHLAVSSL